MTEHIKLITAEVAKPLSEVEADWAKSYAEKEELKKQKTRQLSAVLGYTEQKVLINGHHRNVHHVFVETVDSGACAKLGWVLKSDVNCCMICAKEFTPDVSDAIFFEWWDEAKVLKNYCYACGNIVCNGCLKPDSVVKEIANLGTVPVCKQCSYGQDEVVVATSLALPPSYRVHQKVTAATSAANGATSAKHAGQSAHSGTAPAGSAADKSLTPRSTVSGAAGAGTLEDSIPRVWKYGNVRVEKVIPAFCYEARTKERTRVFINVCTNAAVPFNLSPDQPHKRSSPLTRKSQELCVLIGERGISATVEGAVVYDIVLHPGVVAQCGLDATGVLKERICAEILRTLRRLDLEPDFTLFSYIPTASASSAAVPSGITTASTASTEGVYHARHFSYQQKLSAQSDEEAWRADFRKSLPRKTVTDNFADLAEDDNIFGDEAQLRVYLPMPSISAFFHMEQIATAHSDLQRPMGLTDRRWLKYAEITQLADGTLHIPNNKRARKSPAAVGEISYPVLLSEISDDRTLDRYGSHLKTYSANLYASNGFLITAPRTSKTSKEDVVVHVLHHPFVDDFARSGLLDKDRDDVDPLLLLSKKSTKVKQQDGSTQRAYSVLIGSSYIVGIDDLTGRRILAPERIIKILRRVNVVFAEEINVQQYVLSGIECRPVTEPSPLSAYTYERPLFGTVAEDPPKPLSRPPSVAGSATGAAQVAAKQKPSAPPAKHVLTPSWDANSVLSDLSNPDALMGGSTPAASQDAWYDDSVGMRQSVDSAQRKSTAKRLKQFLLGSRSSSGVPVPRLGSESIDFTASRSMDQGDVEHKADSPERKMNAHRPSPLNIISENSSLSGATSPTSAPVPAPASASSTPRTNSSTPTTGGLGLGATRGLTLTMPGPVKSTSRTSIASVHSESFDDQSPVSPSANAKSPGVKSMFVRESPTPLHHSRDGSGNIHAAALAALSSDGDERDSMAPTPEAGKPPTSRHSLRAFFTRENSATSTTRHTISGVLSRSGSADVLEARPQTPTASPPPSASGAGNARWSMGMRLSSSDSHSNANTPRASSVGVASSVSAKLARGVKPASIPGKELVSPDMLEYAVHLSVNRAVSEGLIKQSAKDPTVLFGWQIRVSSHMQEEGKGLYVVSAVTKNVIGPPDFRLTNLIKDDTWVRLKRGTHDGLLFTPVRRVLTLEG